eukprot:SAG31_NODE_57_length_29727_cov_12.584568_19_plen_2101_part_00
MAAFGLDPEDPLFETVMANADEDGDGEVTLEEFLQVMEGDENGAAETEILEAYEEVANENPFRRQVRGLFRQMDTDNSGWVSRDELIEALDRTGLDFDADAVEDLLVSADSDGDGQVTIEELLAAADQVEKAAIKQQRRDDRAARRAAKKAGTNRGRAEALFQSMDKQERGFIDAKQLYDGLWRAGFAGTNAAHVKRMMKLADKDRDGRLTLEEFLNCFNGIEEDDTESESSSESDPEAELAETELEAELTPEEEAAKQEEAQRQEEMRHERERVKDLFEQMDADQSGWLSKDEIFMLVRTLGLKLSNSQLQAAMAEMDEDGSGEVMYDEFESWWMAQRERGGASGTLAGSIFSSLGMNKIVNIRGARSVGNALGAKDRAGVLHVCVAQARRLPVMENGGADPYCILDVEGASYKTKTRRNTLAPKWEETFSFNVKSSCSKFTLRVLDSDVGSDDLIGRVSFIPKDVESGQGKFAGDRWWPIRPAKGGLTEANMIAAIGNMKTTKLQTQLLDRGYGDKGVISQMSKKAMKSAMIELGLGDVQLRCVFRPEGQFGWEDDEDVGSGSDDEEQMWKNISNHIGTGRRPVDCFIKYLYKDTSGAELPEDYWTKEEESKLEAAIRRFAEPVSPDQTLIPIGGISRVVTAVAALQLVEKGLLDLNEDVSSYSDLDIIRHLKATITGKDHENDTPFMSIEHILTNRSGLDHKWTGIAGHGQELIGRRENCFRLCRSCNKCFPWCTRSQRFCAWLIIVIASIFAIAALVELGTGLGDEKMALTSAISTESNVLHGTTINVAVEDAADALAPANTTSNAVLMEATSIESSSWSGSGFSTASSSWTGVALNSSYENQTNLSWSFVDRPSKCSVERCSSLSWDAAGRQGGSLLVCGESDAGAGLDCIADANATHAQSICHELGARLCTANELLEGEGVGTGCGHDNRLVWSESSRIAAVSCKVGEQLAVWWWSGGNGGEPLRCIPVSNSAAVRCCADVAFDVENHQTKIALGIADVNQTSSNYSSLHGTASVDMSMYSQELMTKLKSLFVDGSSVCQSSVPQRAPFERDGICCLNSSLHNSSTIFSTVSATAASLTAQFVTGTDKEPGLSISKILAALYLVAFTAGVFLLHKWNVQKLNKVHTLSLEAAAVAALAPDEMGKWLNEYFPHVVRPPGSLPGCPLYGYALLGHVIEQLSHRRFWHYTHEKIFQPLTMIATSFGGAHLPSIGPDPAAFRQEMDQMEHRRRARETEIQRMVAKLDHIQLELKAKEEEKQAALAETDAINPIYFSNAAILEKLEAVQAEQSVRYEALESERARDEQAGAELAAKRQTELENLANDRSQLRPPNWNGVWPPKRWIGYISHQPWLPTTLWQRGPQKWRHPDRAAGFWAVAKGAVVIYYHLLRAWMCQMAAAWQRLLRPEAPIGFGSGHGLVDPDRPKPPRRRLLNRVDEMGSADVRTGGRLGTADNNKKPVVIQDDAVAVMSFIEAGISEDLLPPEPPPPPPRLLPMRQAYHRCPSLAPANGMHTTARDMGKLMCMLLSSGKYKKHALLQPTTVAAGFATAWSAHPHLPGDTILGLAEYWHGAERVLLADGGDPLAGSSTCLLLMPERRLGLFVAFNCYGRGAANVRPNLAERFLDQYFSIEKQSAAALEAHRADADLAEQNRLIAAMDDHSSGDSLPASNASSPESAKIKSILKKPRAKKRQVDTSETAAAATARWHAQHFEQYAAAVLQADRKGGDGNDHENGVDSDEAAAELARILALARPQNGGPEYTADGKTIFEAWRYVGTYMTTLASVSTIDTLRGFEGQVRVGIDREGRLYIRRLGVAGGADSGAGGAHRGLVEHAFSDCILEAVDPAHHLFRRIDRPAATGPLADKLDAQQRRRLRKLEGLAPASEEEESSDEDGAVAVSGSGAGCSYVAFGVGWDGRAKFLFLSPSRAAFRRIGWTETLGPTVLAFSTAAIASPIAFWVWVYLAPAGDDRGHCRWPWTVDWTDQLKHESIPREFCSWLLALTLGLIATTSVSLAMILPYSTHSGSPDQWAVGPPWYVRFLLIGVLATIVLGKGLVLATLYVWLQEWWLLWERTFFTATSVCLVPWILLLSRWNLVLFRY